MKALASTAASARASGGSAAATLSSATVPRLPRLPRVSRAPDSALAKVASLQGDVAFAAQLIAASAGQGGGGALLGGNEARLWFWEPELTSGKQCLAFS